jgi:L-amino acid N-acyltransferase YncA
MDGAYISRTAAMKTPFPPCCGEAILRVMQIRPATPDDIAAIAALYGHHVRHGTGTFEEVPPSADDMAGRLARVLDAGWPWLVAEADGAMLGYAYAAQFRDRSAYRFACEDSIYLAPEAAGKGLGTSLLAALIEAATRCGFTTILAVIGDSANAGSIALHRKFGFTEVGTMARVGYKFERWLDVVILQRDL